MVKFSEVQECKSPLDNFQMVSTCLFVTEADTIMFSRQAPVNKMKLCQTPWSQLKKGAEKIWAQFKKIHF